MNASSMEMSILEMSIMEMSSMNVSIMELRGGVVCGCGGRCGIGSGCGVVLSHVEQGQRRACASRNRGTSTAPFVVLANGWLMVKVQCSWRMVESEKLC